MADRPSDIEAVDESNGLVMYCRSWCPDCARARKWLEDHDIPFTEIDVDENSTARSHAEGLNGGRLHTPTFKMGDGVCIDFRPERLKDLLEID